MTKPTATRKGRRRRLRYSFTPTYLEIARSAVTSLDAKRLRALRRSRGMTRVASLLFAAASITIIYSYLAVESFVNYQLYQLWMDPSGIARREIQRSFPKVHTFLDLRLTKARGLRERFKLLCKLLRCRPLHEARPEIWHDFINLLESSRHFLAHPIPDPIQFQANMSRIMKDTEAGSYFVVAQEVIRYVHTETKATPPAWLNANTTVKLAGFTLVAPTRQSRKSAV